jgi:hypothetical protein
MGINVLFSNTPSFNIVVQSWVDSFLLFSSTSSFSGGCNGTRYGVQEKGLIQTYGRGANFIPGTSAGVSSTDGFYY